MNKKLLAVLFGSALMLAACGGDDSAKETDTTKTEPAETTETASVDAEKIVGQSCISCHGTNLEGQGSFPALKDVGARLSEEEILTVIEKGRGAMPGGIISGEDAKAVALWLSEKK
ncbi:cytochrome c551 [Psychrobacillus insolitus]|uniref:Cytochrome c551 n=1 Tax=Psychrobacillus insolitus TaxID=1461 RepID=A0A2W7MLJ1_9BACI|nr:c-type cytochrome [Psychrobacillus insolitus]PZX08232.1 cytochrome c551 [Psychrobacillus insolitus]